MGVGQCKSQVRCFVRMLRNNIKGLTGYSVLFRLVVIPSYTSDNELVMLKYLIRNSLLPLL